MRRFSSGTIAAILLVATSFPADSQQPNVAPQKWQLTTDNGWCKVSTGDPHSGYLMLQVTPGSGESRLYIVGPTKAIRTSRGDDSKVEVTLAVGSQNYAMEGSRFGGRIGGTSVMRLHPASATAGFIEALSRATEIRVEGLPGPLAIPTRGAIVATNGLAKCEDRMLSGWGIDPVAFHRLAVPPRMASKDWIGGSDYPNSALQNAKQGGVVIRADVDASGRITNCVTVATSGYEPLDKVTCALLVSKGSFKPALGPDGQPTAASQTVRVTFTMEDF